MISYSLLYGGFPKLGVPFGVPIIRTVVYLGLYWGTPILGNYHICYHRYECGYRQEGHLVFPEEQRPAEDRAAACRPALHAQRFSKYLFISNLCIYAGRRQ